MILFLNTCNGGLEISNTKIEAIENRVVFLNGNDVYNTYSCTNSKRFMFLKKLLSDIPWQFNDSLIYDDTEANDPRCFYFTHMFLFKHIEKSIHFNIIVPILEFLNPKVLIRAKANLYTYTETLFEHSEHIDTPYECKNAIFYLDNSNGFTRVGNQIIESRENRIALMPTMMHNSTNCSNSKFRMTINFNYF